MMWKRKGRIRMRLLPKIVIEVIEFKLHLIWVDEVYDYLEGSHTPMVVYYMYL